MVRIILNIWYDMLRDSTEVCSRTHLKRKKSKTFIFMLATYLIYQNILIGLPTILQLGLKLECISWSTDMIQV